MPQNTFFHTLEKINHSGLSNVFSSVFSASDDRASINESTQALGINVPERMWHVKAVLKIKHYKLVFLFVFFQTFETLQFKN